MRTAYFCDFDGTIGKKDIGNTVLNRFGSPSWLDYNQRFIDGEIGSKECLIGQFEAFNVDIERLIDFVLEQELDETFKDFVLFMKARGDRVIVVSDGLDIYIKPLFNKYGLNDVELRCNHAEIINNRLKLSFPYSNVECLIRECANCKCGHLFPFVGWRRVFVGDGYSDVCAASYSDFVYAKSDLIKIAQDKGWNYKTFDTFSDIIKMES